MPFQKGQSGKAAGKIKGTLSAKTKEHRSRAQALIEKIENHPKFDTMLDTLSDREMAGLYKDLLEYLEPRLARQEDTDANGGPLVINVLHSVVVPPMQIEETECEVIENINTKVHPF